MGYTYISDVQCWHMNEYASYDIPTQTSAIVLYSHVMYLYK